MRKAPILLMVAAMMVVATFSCSKQKVSSPAAETSDETVVSTVSDTQAVQVSTPTESPTDETTASVDEMAAPDITLKDLGGKTISLHSLRGKPVVLDFWGSWCVWCIRGFPKMKEYYQKYSGKFEILGIDCNDSDEAWRKAVKENALPWLQVYCPEGSTVFDDYDIQGFPTKIVLDAQGRVLKTFLGEDPAFYQYLDELFKD